MRRVAVIGVPTSAGAFAPGQEQAPRALREAGLLDRLSAAGCAVRDDGDRESWRWRPDRTSPRAQNLGAVIEIVGDTADRVSAALDQGEFALVLGGDCTVGIGTAAGTGEGTGLLYFDAHADLNVPDSVPEGALDWMGMAHMLAEPGAVPELVTAGPRLSDDGVVAFGWNPGRATRFEREAITRRGLSTHSVEEVATDPAGAARAAIGDLAAARNRVAVHFDVDVIDFTDTPLSEHTGRNEGLSYADAMAALTAMVADPRVVALTLTELNPAHVEEGAGTLERLAADLAAAVAQG